MKTTPPNDLQLDALREVANVGAGHAAKALSQLTGGQKMGMDIPRALRVEATELAELLGGASSPVVAVTFELTGALSGQILLVWMEKDARELTGWLVKHGGPSNQEGAVTSALAEAANIIASACLSAMGQLTGLKLMPSVPTIRHGLAQDVARSALGAEGPAGPHAGWVLEVRLSSAALSAQLLLIPDPASLSALLAKLGT